MQSYSNVICQTGFLDSALSKVSNTQTALFKLKYTFNYVQVGPKNGTPVLILR